MRTNIHTHSNFSDGKNSPEEMVLSAITKGLSALGFSDHGYSPFDDASMPLDTEACYREEVLRLRAKYADRIEIALGYEHDATYPNLDRSLYDYVIESVHFLQKDGVTKAIDYSPECFTAMLQEMFGGDIRALNSNYFESICRSIEGESGLVVGHIGLTCKYNERHPLFDEEDRDYLNAAKEALAFAVERDKIIEINTGAIGRGWRTTPYPGAALLKCLREMGGRILISSDCHSESAIDCAFSQTYALAGACGFREVWQWKNGRFVPESL